jgi:hypothetical protein
MKVPKTGLTTEERVKRWNEWARVGDEDGQAAGGKKKVGMAEASRAKTQNTFPMRGSHLQEASNLASPGTCITAEQATELNSFSGSCRCRCQGGAGALGPGGVERSLRVAGGIEGGGEIAARSRSSCLRTVLTSCKLVTQSARGCMSFYLQGVRGAGHHYRSSLGTGIIRPCDYSFIIQQTLHGVTR